MVVLFHLHRPVKYRHGPDEWGRPARSVRYWVQNSIVAEDLEDCAIRIRGGILACSE